MLDKFKALMAPLSTQLQAMQQNLTQLGQAPDTAMELGLTNPGASEKLQLGHRENTVPGEPVENGQSKTPWFSGGKQEEYRSQNFYLQLVGLSVAVG